MSWPMTEPDISPLLLSQKGSLFLTRPTLMAYTASRADLELSAGRVIDAIEPLEQELEVNVVSSLQTIAWESLRRTGVNDRIEGYGKLLRAF